MMRRGRRSGRTKVARSKGGVPSVPSPKPTKHPNIATRYKPTKAKYDEMVKAALEDPTLRPISAKVGLHWRIVKRGLDHGFIEECGPEFGPIRAILAKHDEDTRVQRDNAIAALLAVHEQKSRDRNAARLEEAVAVKILRGALVHTALSVYESATAHAKISPAVQATMLSLVEGGKLTPAALQGILESQVALTTGLAKLTDSMSKLFAMEHDLFDREEREAAALAGKRNEVPVAELHANMMGSVTNIQDRLKARRAA